MHVVVWEFRVRAGHEPEFEAVYGERGEWAALFARGTGYVSSILMRDPKTPGRYMTIDRWMSADAFATFLDSFGVAYDELDIRCEPLTTSEKELGGFDVID